MFANINRALVICPHTDDELGCAGLIIRLISDNVDVNYIALSNCEDALPPDIDKDTLFYECFKSTGILGIEKDKVDVLRCPVHKFPEIRQSILELFLDMSKLAPDLVLVPSSHDTNQDHSTVYQESFRVFKHTNILGYEAPQNMREFDNTMYVRLSQGQLEKKIRAIRQYESQASRPYMDTGYIYSLARVRGMQCNSMYAESYEVIRWIV